MVSNQEIKHMKWCAESQMEKLWDLREKLADALGELLELRQREEWVKVSPESMPEKCALLSMTNGQTIHQGFLSMSGDFLYCITGHVAEGITHYRYIAPELPAPPKEGL